MAINNEKKIILLNAVMATVQVVATGVALFVLYRFLIRELGPERLGIWSVVLATTSVANIANLGLSGSVVKFVSKYLAREQADVVSRVVQTATLTMMTILGTLILSVYPFIGWLLGLVIAKSRVAEALAIVPYSALSLWMMMVASVFQASLEGCQRIYLRSVVYLISTLAYVAMCLALVGGHGLMGLAYSQVGQAFLVLTGNWFVLRRFVRLPLVPHVWDRKLFREMLGYGINFQLVSICHMLYDPVTKSLISKFGGLAMNGYYEMANRMVVQVRAVVFSANKVLIPAIAGLQEKRPELIQDVYRTSYRLLFFISFPVFTSLVAFAPVVSRIWIGHYEPMFVLFASMLSAGWLMHTLLGPAFISNLGMGELRWNTAGNVFMAVFNPLAGYALGRTFGGEGVVAAWAATLCLGSIIIVLAYHRRHELSLRLLVPRESISIGVASFTGLGVSLVFYHALVGTDTMYLFGLTALIYTLILALPVMRHPMRKNIASWVTEALLKARG